MSKLAVVYKLGQTVLKKMNPSMLSPLPPPPLHIQFGTFSLSQENEFLKQRLIENERLSQLEKDGLMSSTSRVIFEHKKAREEAEANVQTLTSEVTKLRSLYENSCVRTTGAEDAARMWQRRAAEQETLSTQLQIQIEQLERKLKTASAPTALKASQPSKSVKELIKDKKELMTQLESEKTLSASLAQSAREQRQLAEAEATQKKQAM